MGKLFEHTDRFCHYCVCGLFCNKKVEIKERYMTYLTCLIKTLTKIAVSFIVIVLFTFLTHTPAFAQQSLNLSPNGRSAINTLATDILLNGPNPHITALKPQLDPQDYATVKNIGLLPDSPWYFLKNIGRGVRLFFTFDQVGKTQQLLKDGNEKTLEALLITEKATNEKDATKQDQLVAVAAQTLDSVGADFNSTVKTLDSVKKTDSIQAYLFQQEAFQFAGYYQKHQILLQKQQDKLSEKDFLLLEVARVKHLDSIASIVVGESRDPVIFGQQLSQLLSSEVGSNNTQLATIAVLRDLENNATSNEIPALQNAQIFMQKELEIKLANLPKTERLQQIQEYIFFVHGNPIREFQAYNFLSKSFASEEMTILTSALKDAASQDFKKHLSALDNTDLQKQFVATMFSNYPIDMRLLFYTEVQLNNNKATEQLKNLEAIKTLLEVQVCSVYGKDPKALTQTRFYSEATAAPSLLDIKIGTFLNKSLQDCNGRTPEALATITDLQTKIATSFAKEAQGEVFTKLPTLAQAEAILKEVNITVPVQDEQRVAEKIDEETKIIEEEISENPTALQKEVQQIVETITTPTQETVTEQLEQAVIEEKTIASDSQTIVEEIIEESEPTQGEITQKEEQIIEEIVDSAEMGETSPLVEELPQEVQEEIAEETGVPLPIVTPIPTIVQTVVPVTQPTNIPTPTRVPVAPTTILEPVVTTVQETSQSTPSEPTPAAPETEVVPGL